MTSTEIANVTASLENAGMYSTVKGTDEASRKLLFNAVNSAESISELLSASKDGFTIKVSNIVIQQVDVANEVTGEVETAPRVIFIDDKGKAYSALSKGLLQSVRNIIGLLGEPSTWDAPIAFKVTEKKSRRGFRFMTLEIAG